MEVDGDSHAYEEIVEKDRRRDEYLTGHGWRVLRFTNEEVYRGLDYVVREIAARTTPPSSP